MLGILGDELLEGSRTAFEVSYVWSDGDQLCNDSVRQPKPPSLRLRCDIGGLLGDGHSKPPIIQGLPWWESRRLRRDIGGLPGDGHSKPPIIQGLPWWESTVHLTSAQGLAFWAGFGYV